MGRMTDSTPLAYLKITSPGLLSWVTYMEIQRVVIKTFWAETGSLLS